MTRLVIILVSITSACSSSRSGEPTTIGNLTFEAPSGWTRRDLSTHQRAMAEWAPGDNERKETVTVIRVERALAKAKDATARIDRLLGEAQQNLPGGKFGSTARFSTKSGLHGVRIEGAFTPAGQPAPVHRMHAVLADGTALVHVIYTAREADREAFELVVDSMRRGG